MSKIILVVFIIFALTIKIVHNSNHWRLCPPCRCFGDKRADCSQERMNITLTSIPDFLSSEIEALNVTKHNIVTLKNDIFNEANLTNLWKVYLEKCNINIIEKHAFRSLEQMTDLSLMYNEISELDSEIFSTNTNLKYLWLDNNKITKLPNNLCFGLIGLSGLYARFNLISSVENAVFSNHPDLWIIDISNNKLQYLNATIIHNLKSLKVLFLHANIWSCDCRMKYLHEIMIDRNLYNLTKTVCTSPSNLRGKELKLLKLNEFKCWQNVTAVPPQNRTTFEYSNVTFSCIINALPEPKITWMHNKSYFDENNTKYIINSLRNDTIYYYNITILNLTSNDTGMYSCKVGNNEFETANLTVLKIQKPTVKIIQNYTQIIQSEKENVLISCIVFGRPKPYIYWTYNNTIIHNSTNNYIISESNDDLTNKYWVNVTIKTLNYSSQGHYNCWAKYATFQSTQKVFLSVLPPFAPKVKIPTKNSFKVQSNSTISCYIQSYSTPTLTWEYTDKNNNKFVVTNSSKYSIDVSFSDNNYWCNITIKNVTSKNLGEYTCIAKTKEGKGHYKFSLKTLISKPKIKLYSNSSILKNMNGMIACFINAYPVPQIYWNFNTTNLKITEDNKYELKFDKKSETEYWSNLTIFNVTLKNSGFYGCYANNTEGFASKFTSLTVLKQENVIDLSGIWYIVICLVAGFIVVTIVLIVSVIYSKKSSSKHIVDLSRNAMKTKEEENKMNDIPLGNCSESNFTKDCTTKDEDIMYIIERDVTSYNVTECEK